MSRSCRSFGAGSWQAPVDPQRNSAWNVAYGDQPRRPASAHPRIDADGRDVTQADLHGRQVEIVDSAVLETGLDSASSARAVASFPAKRPLLALDRIFGSTLASVSDLASHDTPLARLASDHLPIRARLRLG